MSSSNTGITKGASQKKTRISTMENTGVCLKGKEHYKLVVQTGIGSRPQRNLGGTGRGQTELSGNSVIIIKGTTRRNDE